MASLSRQLAQWVVGLRYDDLPPAVVDRAKSVTLHGVASVLLGSESRDGQQAVKLIAEEEAGVTPFGALAVGYVAETFGTPTACAAGGAGGVLSVAILTVLWRRRRAVY